MKIFVSELCIWNNFLNINKHKKHFHEKTWKLTKYVGEYRKRGLEVFCKKGVLKNLTKFTGKHCVRVSFLLKCRLEACNFIKKETGTGDFLWIVGFSGSNICKCIRHNKMCYVQCVKDHHSEIVKNMKYIFK